MHPLLSSSSLTVLLLLLLSGCAPPPPDVPPPGKGEPSDEGQPDSSGEAVVSAPSAAADRAPKPLEGLPRTEICRHDELLLIKWPVQELVEGGWKTQCCGPDSPFGEGRCELDWPSSDMLSCSAWGEMRNGIYARYGYPFKKEEWKAAFGKWEWYSRRDDYDPSWLSEVARANVAALQRFETEGNNCMK